MAVRGWLLLALAVAAIGWWFSPLSPHAPDVAALAPGVSPRCPPPPRVSADGISPGAPLQSAVPASLQPFRLAAAQLQPLAGFSVDARVLSRKDYRRGREAALSPTDLALGWAAMADMAMAERLQVSQSGRWYHYRWRGEPPLPPGQIASSSANMHLIPADARVAAALRAVRTGERVRIDGWLVEAAADDGWRWRSSLSRTDTGAGACELIYVCAITRE